VQNEAITTHKRTCWSERNVVICEITRNSVSSSGKLTHAQWHDFSFGIFRPHAELTAILCPHALRLNGSTHPPSLEAHPNCENMKHLSRHQSNWTQNNYQPQTDSPHCDGHRLLSQATERSWWRLHSWFRGWLFTWGSHEWKLYPDVTRIPNWNLHFSNWAHHTKESVHTRRVTFITVFLRVERLRK